MSDHVKTIQAIYECFGRGDIPGVLEHLDPDVRWNADWAMTPPPLLAPRIGREEVAEYFAALGAYDVGRFEPLEFLAGGDWVAVPIQLELRHKATGKVAADLEVHLWRFSPDGKVVWFRSLLDGRLFE
jgi:ketosteroid isomerase-like protein